MSDGVGGITEMTGRKPLIEHELIMLRFHGSLAVVLEPLLLWSGKNMQHNNIAKSGNVEKFHSMLWWAQVNPKTWLLVGDAMMSSRLRLIRTETEVQSEKGLATILSQPPLWPFSNPQPCLILHIMIVKVLGLCCKDFFLDCHKPWLWHDGCLH